MEDFDNKSRYGPQRVKRTLSGGGSSDEPQVMQQCQTVIIIVL